VVPGSPDRKAGSKGPTVLTAAWQQKNNQKRIIQEKGRGEK